MLSAISPEATRIPAWKRLGLKLKSQASDETPEGSVEADLLKRKSTESLEQRPAKKSKQDPKSLLPFEPATTPSVTRKKSVTFTPETKVEDGDSIRQLFGAWVAEQKAQDPSFQPKSNQAFDTPEPPKVEEQVDTKLGEKERRVERAKVGKTKKAKAEQPDTTPKQKKPKAPKSPKVEKTTKATPPFLTYLKQHHESRESWKFNKNHQNHLLKNVFNLAIIPSEYAPLIYEYVRGLQGGVRTRLRDETLTIKVKDLEDVPTEMSESMSAVEQARAKEEQKRQKEYNVAMEEYVATMTLANASSKMGYEEGVLLNLSDNAMKDRMAKRMRAEQILKELGTHQEGNLGKELRREADGSTGVQLSYLNDDSQKGLRMNNGTSQKAARKRKQRTNVEDETSSSGKSTDSSDSESGTDTDSETPSERRAGIESSSSSSSSSSSGSDDEDDEDDSSEEDSSEDESD